MYCTDAAQQRTQTRRLIWIKWVYKSAKGTLPFPERTTLLQLLGTSDYKATLLQFSLDHLGGGHLNTPNARWEQFSQVLKVTGSFPNLVVLTT